MALEVVAIVLAAALWRLLLTLLLIGAEAVAASSGYMLKWVDGDTNYRRGERSTPYFDAVKEPEAQASVCLLLASSFSLEIKLINPCGDAFRHPVRTTLLSLPPPSESYTGAKPGTRPSSVLEQSTFAGARNQCRRAPRVADPICGSPPRSLQPQTTAVSTEPPPFGRSRHEGGIWRVPAPLRLGQCGCLQLCPSAASLASFWLLTAALALSRARPGQASESNVYSEQFDLSHTCKNCQCKSKTNPKAHCSNPKCASFVRAWAVGMPEPPFIPVLCCPCCGTKFHGSCAGTNFSVCCAPLRNPSGQSQKSSGKRAVTRASKVPLNTPRPKKAARM